MTLSKLFKPLTLGAYLAHLVKEMDLFNLRGFVLVLDIDYSEIFESYIIKIHAINGDGVHEMSWATPEDPEIDWIKYRIKEMLLTLNNKVQNEYS